VNVQPAVLSVSHGLALAVWIQRVGARSRYEVAELARLGGVTAGAKDLFGGQDWGGVSSPVLVSDAGSPLLIFSGQRGLARSNYDLGCVVGELLTPAGWTLQPWTLSQSCTFSNVGFGGATVTGNNVLSAAWGGGGVQYRIGAVSLPAATPDSIAKLPSGDSDFVNEATNSQTGDVYGGWYQFFSKPASIDGAYVADFSANSAPKKVPGSGTNTSGHPIQRLAMASPAGRGGIYAALCSDSYPCRTVELWRYGSKKVQIVPGSSLATSVALSAGPAGRLWLAWWNSTTNRVYTVRTNEADNSFGPVESYAAPNGCTGIGGSTIAITGGSSQRLDVVLTCYTSGVIHAVATQSLTALHLAASTSSLSGEKGGSISYVITDAGDPVQGAGVTVDSHQGKTNKSGRITYTFPKGSKTGTFPVKVTKANYFGASGTLHIT
jgi:hypothetical protein